MYKWLLGACLFALTPGKVPEVPEVAHWNEEPVIMLCMGSDITPQRMHKAMRWWEKQGAKFTRPFLYGRCPEGGVAGIITVTTTDATLLDEAIGMPDQAAGVTFMAYDYDDHMHTSHVIIRDAFVDTHVMEHELGHALGLAHYPVMGHVMHPYYEFGGYGKSGLKKALKD